MTNAVGLIADEVIRAVAGERMLPREAYLSAELYEAERAAVFDHAWTLACHASEVGASGSFRRVRVYGEDLIVTRDRDGVLHAMYNVCRHRAAEVVTQDRGTARRLVCPYHQWSYELNGRLATAPGMPDGFCKDDYPLPRAWVREWQGLVLVSLDEPRFGEPFEGDVRRKSLTDDELTAGRSRLDTLRLEEAKAVHTEIYDIAANWKIVLENFSECYHCRANHPEFVTAFDLDSLYDENGDQRNLFPIKDGMCSLSLDGQPVSTRLFGEFANVPTAQWRYASGTSLPFYAIIAGPDYGTVFSFQPTSAEATRFVCQWIVHRDAVEGVDYDLHNVTVVWHQTNLQDAALCESNHRGVRSRAYAPGPPSMAREPWIMGLHRQYTDWLPHVRRAGRDAALASAR